MRAFIWKLIMSYLNRHELTREERIDILNYFNKEIKAFPIEDCVVILTTGMITANGKEMTLEQRESFLQGAKALVDNKAFNLIADQMLYQCMQVGIHNSTSLDHMYFTKVAIYFTSEFKKMLQKLDRLA